MVASTIFSSVLIYATSSLQKELVERLRYRATEALRKVTKVC